MCPWKASSATANSCRRNRRTAITRFVRRNSSLENREARPRREARFRCASARTRANHWLQTRLASSTGLLVVLGRVQFLAEHPSSPVRYRLRGFGQLPADELCHYAVATAMRGIVVHDQLIGVLTDFEEILWRLPRGINHT